MKLAIVLLLIFLSQFAELKYSKVEILPPPNKNIFKFPNASQEFENGNHFEGDIVLTPEQYKYFTTSTIFRTGVIDPVYRWPKEKDGLVYVPYVFDKASKYSNEEKKTIRDAMDYIELYTCIKFVERKKQLGFINIASKSGCYSMIGKQGGSQEVSLKKNDCFLLGTIVHELIHALGFHHMHNHIDRDKFVTIQKKNIIEKNLENFTRVNAKYYKNFDTEYDYMSVMHYPPKAFSKNGEITVLAKNDTFKEKIGQRDGFSMGDVDRINGMYDCGRFKLLSKKPK